MVDHVALLNEKSESLVGCHGCFWFDMAAWRTALNRSIRERK